MALPPGYIECDGCGDAFPREQIAFIAFGEDNPIGDASLCRSCRGMSDAEIAEEDGEDDDSARLTVDDWKAGGGLALIVLALLMLGSV